MWSLERCKSLWFVEERQRKENTNNLQLWQKVPQKQLNNFPVTLETEFTPQQTGKIACNYHPGVKHQFGQNINICLLQLL